MSSFKPITTSRSPFIIFFCAAAIAVLYMFYFSAVRTHVENYFYDIRTVLKPKQASSDIVILAIDKKTIATLTNNAGGDLPYVSLLDLTKKLMSTSAKEIVVLTFTNIFNDDASEVEELKTLVKSDARLTLGTLGLYTSSPSSIELPSTFGDIDSQVYGVDALRKRSNSVVRWLPFFGYQGQNLKPLLPYYIAKKTLQHPILKGNNPEIEDERKQTLSWYLLNYTSPEKFKQISASDFLVNPERYNTELHDKIVLLGYAVFQEWATQTREPMVANTPLQGQVDTYKKGAPIIYLVANGIDNLLNHSWLNPAPIWVNIIQITIISLILGFVWRFGVVAATLTIFTTWALLFWGHGYAFTFGDLFIPLSDTALFSSFALILGALWRLNADIKVQTEIKAKTSVKADLASLQSSFLDRFAYELAAINDSLKNRLKNVVVKDSANATEKTLLPRALESCEDFSEYLEGIKQSAAVEGRDHHRPQKSDVKVKTIVDAVLSRFETKIEEKKLQLKLSCPEGLSVYSDAKILDTIIYNLVSNAVKYSPKNSLIEITVETSGNSKVVFCVRDEGPGITPEHLEKIFEKFYRIKDEVVYSVKGTGLGLYLCRYFADQIDVKVWCESQPKKSWTRFFIEVEKSKT